MPVKEKKTKSQIAAAAAAGARNKKKKWAKTKRVEKAKSAVLFTADLYNKFSTEVPKMKVITPHMVSERLKINISLAREGLRELENSQKIRKITDSQSTMIYTSA